MSSGTSSSCIRKTDDAYSLSDGISEEEAVVLATKLSEDMRIPQFDNNSDLWIGDVEIR